VPGRNCLLVFQLLQAPLCLAAIPHAHVRANTDSLIRHSVSSVYAARQASTFHAKFRKYRLSRAAAHVASRRFPTTGFPVKSQVSPRAIRGGQSSTGAGYLRTLWFLAPIHIPPTAPYGHDYE
jgi:hypothetical protein